MRGLLLFFACVAANCYDGALPFNPDCWFRHDPNNDKIKSESITLQSEGNLFLNAQDDILLKFKNTPHSSVQDFSVSLRNLVREHQEMKKLLLRMQREIKKRK